MKIINAQKARGSQVKIIFDNESEILLDKEYFLNSTLSIGLDLDESEIDKIKVESDFIRAKARAVYYLSNGDLSKKSLTQKLKTAGFLEQNVQKAVERMVQLGYVDDYKYALRLAESFKNQNISLLEAKHKMYEKGIPNDVINEAIASYDADPVEQIKNIITKKYSAKLNTPENVNKVFSALVRKGFSFADVKTALRLYAEDIEFSED